MKKFNKPPPPPKKKLGLKNISFCFLGKKIHIFYKFIQSTVVIQYYKI